MSLPTHTLYSLVKKLSLWADFSAAEEEAIMALPYRRKELLRHDHIVREREETTQSCLLLSGYAIRHKIVATGARQIIAIQMRGDMVDLQNSILGVANHSVQMITQGEVAFIPSDAVRALAFAHPNVGLAMWKDTLVDASIFGEWVANVGRRDAHTRLAHLLCEFALRLKVAGLGESTEYELPMTQEQLADCTGLTPVHINRMLKTLERENLITRQGPRSVIIGDWKKLAAAGDFDANYLHLRQDEPALN